MDSTQLLIKQNNLAKDLIDNDNFRYAPAKVVSMGQRLVELRRTKDVWEVIRELVKMWVDTSPKEYKSFLVDLDFTKDTGKVTRTGGGSSFTNYSIDESGFQLRHTIDIPVKVIYMIRRLYSVEELPMDKDFYDKMAIEFPDMVVSKMV